MKIGVLVSGRGSNLEAILRARPPGVDTVIVLSNRPGVRALTVAADAGVPARVLARAAFDGDPVRRDRAMGIALTEAAVDVAVLAGYDQLLTRGFFDAFAGRTINIHPSLLPAHGGRGMLGIAVHRAVLAAGDAVSGATVHEVIPELDGGPILAQVRVLVAPTDDPDTLAARVLEAEHRLLVETLASIARSGWAARFPAPRVLA